MVKKILGLSILAFMITQVSAQRLELGVERGFSTYFGDLVPYSLRGSFEGGNAATGLYLAWHTGDKVSLRLNYVNTSLEASDISSSSDSRKIRNINFRSPISEYGLSVSINLVPFINRLNHLDKWRILITSGLNIFHFNPQAYYHGEYIDLQPLGTEGQGTSARPGVEKYSLTQVNIPFGTGLSYEIANNIHLGVGTTFRKTFTDYLDDVSSTYVPLEILAEENGTLAAELSYRTDELTGSLANFKANTIRGNPKENDWYMSTYLSLSFTISKATLKGANPFRRKIKCPHSY